MFRSCVQPPIISLLSSVGSSPLHGLWSTSTDLKLPEDSFITFIDDNSPDSLGSEDSDRRKLINIQDDCGGGKGKQLNCQVIHIQSPTIGSTYLLSPPTGELSLNHSWLHLQIRNLRKEFAFEVGIVDSSNRNGRIRWSTFQQCPRVSHVSRTNIHDGHISQLGPLLHIPLSFPPPSSSSLTTWCTIDVNVAVLLAMFSSVQDAEADASPGRNVLPCATFSSLSYVKVYANCRLRRVWVSHGPPNGNRSQGGWPAEFQLFGDAGIPR
jgi:Protein of unknown function (DUF667)